MTVAALVSRIDYLENGVTLDFAVPFRFLPSTLAVTRVMPSGQVVALAAGADYSVTGGGTDAGGTLTLGASVSGARLRLRRATSRNQATDYTTADRFPAESHEGALDRAMLIDQEQDAGIADLALRSLLVPDGEVAPSLPAKALRGSKYPVFSPDGETLLMSEGTGVDAGLRGDLASIASSMGADLVANVKRVANVKSFGAKGNGTVDDTAAILLAIAYIKSVGGGVVFFPRGVYKVTQTLFIDASYITLAGEGGAVDGNVAYVGGMAAAIAGIASRILWAGTAGGTVVIFTPFPDNGTKAALSGGGMMDIAVDGASVANDGIDLRSLRYAKFTNVSSLRCNSVNWKIGVTNSNVLGGNKSIAFCEFRNITGSNSTIVGNTAKTMVLYGHITDGNVAINKFDNCGFYNATGSGSHIEVENSDSNTFVHCRWNGSLTLHATDTGSFSQGGDAVARHNVFLNPQGHIIAKAKIATPHTQGVNGFDSYGNVAYGYSRENGIAYPTIGAYADFQFHATGLGLTNKEGGIQFGHAPNITLMAKTVDQTIATGATTVVDWDAVSYDWLGCGNATTNRITAPNGAKWVRFIYGVEWSSDSTAGRFAGLRLNGSALISKNQNSGYIASQEVISTQWFAVTPGDYYDMIVSQNTAGNQTLIGGSSVFMQAEWC